MASTSISDGTRTPLLVPIDNNGEQNTEPQTERWWNKILDIEETKHQLMFSLPMILTNLFYYLITLVSVMLVGHLGELQLAGATLANSWFSLTGVAVMVGLSGALETLCGQGFGANEYHLLGIYLQGSCIISFIFSIIISIIWFYTEHILVFFHQSQDIAKIAALYMKFLIPGIFGYSILQNMLRFLQTQSVVMPLVILSAIPTLVHVGIAYGFVEWTSLSFIGGPIATSISLWISMIMLGLYIIFAKKFESTWKGFSMQSFNYLFTNLKLALPSAAMVCLEYWAFEVLVFLAGIMPDSEITTSLIAICANTEFIAYMITYGLSAAASTRVSNELGAGQPERAKHAMGVTLKLSLLLGICFVLMLLFGHNIWIQLFSNSAIMKKEFASITPLLAISILLDSIQGVLSGVARGCGWQHLAVYVNLTTFYLIGLPISCLLGFKTNLQYKGLWIGLICGLVCQTGTLLLLTSPLKEVPVIHSSAARLEKFGKELFLLEIKFRFPRMIRLREDKLIWSDNRDGNYSVRSGYKVMMQVKKQDADLSQRSEWLNLWKIKAPPKAKPFTLADLSRLFAVTYEWHAILTCNTSMQARHTAGLDSILSHRIQHTATLQDLILDVCSTESMEVAGQFAMLAWVLWQNRNNKIWNASQDTGRNLGLKSRYMWDEWNDVQQVTQASRQIEQQQQLHRWE
ncbi:protein DETOXIFICATION [Trifolium repens]|nr:protein DETOXIFICATION [Trifolium repens]